jgi:hypothetical protein
MPARSVLYAGVSMRASRALIFCFLAVVGCKKTPEPTSNPGPLLLGSAPSTPKAPAPAATPSAMANPPVEITWFDPPEWKRSPRVSPMRKATYAIPHVPSEKEDGELGVFYFGPGQGGGVDANVDRWVKQFTDVPVDKVKRADRSANGLVQHTVEVDSGTFNVNAMGGPPKLKTGYALLGAIVEAPSGQYFFKLTGPEATVKAARKAFYKLLDSVSAKS